MLRTRCDETEAKLNEAMAEYESAVVSNEKVKKKLTKARQKKLGLLARLQGRRGVKHLKPGTREAEAALEKRTKYMVVA